MRIDHIRSILNDAKHVVCLFGTEASGECGCYNYRTDDSVYDFEMKYNYSPEEVFSASFYNTRIGEFYKCYQEVILSNLGEPNECVRTLAKMEADGKLKSLVTREWFGLLKRGGCKNVLELHGSVYDNKCPRCGTYYDIEYVKKGKPVPVCEKCGQPVRPQVCLREEMIDNQKMTKAAEEIGAADVLLLIGAHLHTMLAETCVKYFNGDKLIIIHEHEHFSDSKADIVCYGKSADILPQIYPGQNA